MGPGGHGQAEVEEMHVYYEGLACWHMQEDEVRMHFEKEDLEGACLKEETHFKEEHLKLEVHKEACLKEVHEEVHLEEEWHILRRNIKSVSRGT